MSRFTDVTGMRFGKRTAIRREGNNRWNQPLWLTRCDCGREDYVISTRLKKTTQCQTCQVTKHGDSGSRLYRIWGDMKQRCLDENQPSFKYYGKRGITVCNEWREYVPFKEWALSNGYVDNLTIDRINNDGNYEPSNCQWLTIQEQNVAGKKRTRCDNTSNTTGVYYRKDTCKWFAGIGVGKEFRRSTCFDTKEEAIQARQELLP